MTGSAVNAAMEALIVRFAHWAEARADLRAALLAGSRARRDHPADEWSDADIAVFATDPARYLSSADWLDDLGTVWLTFLEKTAVGDGTERRVLFEGGLDVDFAFFPPNMLPQAIQNPAVLRVLRRGFRVLLDKDGELAQWTATLPEIASPRPPTEPEFLQMVHDFWYHAVWVAKKLRRGELWTAKSCCDSYMKWLLLDLIECHSRALHGPDYDTWHSGRFLDQWADPRALAGLDAAFAYYDRDDIARALLATMDLFRWLAAETAERLGYADPSLPDERATSLVQSYLSG